MLLDPPTVPCCPNAVCGVHPVKTQVDKLQFDLSWLTLTSAQRADAIFTASFPWLLTLILAMLFYVTVVFTLPEKTIRNLAVKFYIKNTLRKQKLKEKTTQEILETTKLMESKGFTFEERDDNKQ